MGLLLEGIFKFIAESFNGGAKARGKWTIEDMPDMTGKVVLVTGANSGNQAIFMSPTSFCFTHLANVFIF
jgi:hypothetical protein